MPERVLVTGVSSFTGPYLAQALTERGYEVFGLSQGGPACPGVTVIDGNLLDATSVRAVIDACKPHYVIHLAAITFVPHGDIAQMYLTNVVGTRNLLTALDAEAADLKNVILASSANVYGNSREGALDEETPFAPANDYATSKVAMEYMAGIWASRLPIAIVRPFNYTGVGQAEKFLIPKIVSHFRRAEPEIELGNIDVVRDFSDVRFVAAAYCALLENALPGECYNFCSGTGHALKDIIAAMCQIAGYEIAVKVNPEFVRANEVKRLVGDNARLLQRCPELAPIDMHDTLQWMFRSDV